MISQAFGEPSLQRQGRLGMITLRKPASINAIGPEDIAAITTALRSAVADPAVETVLIRGEGHRGFCAGGDIKRVHHMITSGRLDQLAAFWSEEYRLDHLISTCPKPVVSIAHGLSLGGGVGLASHAAYRVVTDSTRMGMPEVLIGLSPDIGGLWLYSRAPGHTGVFAALTAVHLSAGDALYMGLADHYLPDDQIDTLIDRLHRLPPAEALAGFDHQPVPSWVAAHRDAIDKIFGAHSVPEILALADAANTDAPDAYAVADAAVTALTTGSPTALCVTFEALRRATSMATLGQCLEQDLRVGQHCSRHPDLREGIRARVVDKDRTPHWQPAALAEVTAADIDRFFEPIGTALHLSDW
ncbi:3-hydroxyisobutyryl-CoA hydrolase [Candidatus Mycolicibacterium alkanivorans]|uniref:3-hydroxyisobutyryl-CoA hydrolase n=1 Tax=Candidatus Mycolicibacterium alkanivorans TaxID=2954114 RepID=A0ABS9YX38_9MYCO|nr:3-hydroxyisobutyryl-CoA hydrolase [Candidatus Mycolicibacterium alkanivorans]MCI4675820.1 enoyl-CoA hydratase/isomerase family protein [Candidatus Mycolicibacterium alkanivorans]